MKRDVRLDCVRLERRHTFECFTPVNLVLSRCVCLLRNPALPSCGILPACCGVCVCVCSHPASSGHTLAPKVVDYAWGDPVGPLLAQVRSAAEVVLAHTMHSRAHHHVHSCVRSCVHRCAWFAGTPVAAHACFHAHAGGGIP